MLGVKLPVRAVGVLVLALGLFAPCVLADLCGTKDPHLDWNGECKGDESKEFSESSDCSCASGQPNGKGWLRECGKFIYHGEMKAGKKEGTGFLEYKNGFTYRGQFKNDKRDGLGVMGLVGGTYRGEFVADFPGGYGTSQDSRGQIYAGQYEQRKKHGFAVQQRANGDIYYGQFTADKRTGCGVLRRSGNLGKMMGVLFGQERIGRWVACNSSKECPAAMIYCKCDDDGVKLLPATEEDIQCARAAEEKAKTVAAAAEDVGRQAEELVEGLKFPGEGADFLNITEAQRKEMKRPEIDPATLVPDDDDNGATAMADITAFMAIVGLCQFLNQVLEQKHRWVVISFFCLAMALMAEKSVGWENIYEALSETYKAMMQAYSEEDLQEEGVVRSAVPVVPKLEL